MTDKHFIEELEKYVVKDIYDACAQNNNPLGKPKSSDTKSNLFYKRVFLRLLVVGSTPLWSHVKNVVGPRWADLGGIAWLELCSWWCRLQCGHFGAACQRPKGKLHFSFAIMMSTSYGCAPTLFLFLPSTGDEYKTHPSHRGSIALPVPEVPKMSVRAMCFTSSKSNGGCWMFLVSFLGNLLFFIF